MKLSHFLLIFIFCIPLCNTMQGQEETMTAAKALQEENIQTQFEVVIKKSGKYQEYKVVKREWMDQLKTNTLDTLKVLESKLNETNQKIKEQQTTISGLESTLGKSNESLTSLTEEKDNMSFLGMSFNKGSYKTIMWSIVGVLLVLLAFFIFRFKNSNSVTVEAKKALADTEVEFEDHRRRALEREQKVMRKLQDEINKQRKTGAK